MRPAVESTGAREDSGSPERPSPANRGPRALSRLLSCIRFDEVIVLQGPPLLGAVFSLGRLTGEKVADLVIFGAGSFCLLAHVFALNDWSGMSADSRDPNRTTGVFITKGIGRAGMRYLWMALLALCLLLL